MICSFAGGHLDQGGVTSPWDFVTSSCPKCIVELPCLAAICVLSLSPRNTSLDPPLRLRYPKCKIRSIVISAWLRRANFEYWIMTKSWSNSVSNVEKFWSGGDSIHGPFACEVLRAKPLHHWNLKWARLESGLPNEKQPIGSNWNEASCEKNGTFSGLTYKKFSIEHEMCFPMAYQILGFFPKGRCYWPGKLTDFELLPMARGPPGFLWRHRRSDCTWL